MSSPRRGSLGCRGAGARRWPLALPRSTCGGNGEKRSAAWAARGNEGEGRTEDDGEGKAFLPPPLPGDGLAQFA